LHGGIILRRGNETGRGGGHDAAGSMRWLLTYADLITLLMAFFIVMYAMSRLDAARYASVAEALGRVLRGGVSLGGVLPGGQGAEAQDEMQEVARNLQEYIRSHGLEGKVTLILTPEGLNVSFTGSVLFDLGKADLRPDALPILEEVAGYLSRIPNFVGVAGSTDDLKISTPQFPSNWELSVVRATTVIRFLTEEYGLDPHRFIALGYGEYHPLYPNTSEENRARNRRVDIIIYRQPPFLGTPRTAP